MARQSAYAFIWPLKSQEGRNTNIFLFIFGSNKNFKICFGALLTLVFIFVSIYNFDFFHTFELRWLAIFCYLNPTNVQCRNSEKKFWPKSFLVLFEYLLLFFFIKDNLVCLKGHENYNTTSEKCWTHRVMPWQSCLQAQQHQFKIIFKGIKPNHD